MTKSFWIRKGWFGEIKIANIGFVLVSTNSKWSISLLIYSQYNMFETDQLANKMIKGKKPM